MVSHNYEIKRLREVAPKTTQDFYVFQLFNYVIDEQNINKCHIVSSKYLNHSDSFIYLSMSLR